MRFLPLLVILLIGCNDPKRSLVAKEPPVSNENVNPPAIEFVDFKDKNERTVKEIIGDGGCECVFISTVKKSGEDYEYNYSFSLTGKEGKAMLARWEIADHLMAKVPYLFELKAGETVKITRFSKQRPVWVHRRGSLFDREKTNNLTEFFQRNSVSVTNGVIWTCTEFTASTIIPQDLMRTTDHRK